MMDYSWQLLRQVLLADDSVETILWVVDENINVTDIDSIKVTDNVCALTNRYDIFTCLQQHGITATINDFDFSALEIQQFDAVFYRISKEKAIVHHVINAAATSLKPSGKLWLAGYKKEGIKTYVTKAAKLLGEISCRERGAGTSMLASITRTDISEEKLDDKNYQQTVDIVAGDLHFISKPGIYGWNKLDKGSVFLIQYFEEVLKLLPKPPETIVDLGCGYGYLSVMASQYCEAQFTATDNNIASVQLCQQNFQRHHISGKVLLDDCGASIEPSADMVLCNPPFHQGFGVESDLTIKFVQAAKNLLKRGGNALFVVNNFIALEKISSQHFSEITSLANNGSFKLLLLTK